MCISSVYGHMSGLSKLQEHAATIMAHLEDANMAAMEIQGQNKTLTDISHGLATIHNELRAVDNTLTKIDNLLVILNSQ